MNEITTAVPTLKVMRLQKPELDIAKAGTLKSSGCMLGSSMCLPDSFGIIHVGETFTAYLGAINVSKTLVVTNLTVTAQLQTPSQRWHMDSKTFDECNAAGGCELQPEEGVDSIVSRTLEEAGQHILRVEVGYGGSGGTMKSLRKFYRFQVSNPLVISERAYRTGDLSCFLSIALQNNGHETKGGLSISHAGFEPAPGLISERVAGLPPKSSISKERKTNLSSTTGSEKDRFSRGVDLFDQSERLEPGDSKQYTFKIVASKTLSTSRAPVAGIVAGHQLGNAFFRWHKACGEVGRMASFPVVCRISYPFLDAKDLNTIDSMGNESDFVMHIQGSGLSADIATQAAIRAGKSSNAVLESAINANSGESQSALDLILPITVEPINPPKELQVGIPFDIDFLVVNHSGQFMSIQLQFRQELMKGISICGPSIKNLEDIPENGGSTTVMLRFIALSAGLTQLTGCNVMNLASGELIPQPPMLNMMVNAT